MCNFEYVPSVLALIRNGKVNCMADCSPDMQSPSTVCVCRTWAVCYCIDDLCCGQHRTASIGDACVLPVFRNVFVVNVWSHISANHIVIYFKRFVAMATLANCGCIVHAFSLGSFACTTCYNYLQFYFGNRCICVHCISRTLHLHVLHSHSLHNIALLRLCIHTALHRLVVSSNACPCTSLHCLVLICLFSQCIACPCLAYICLSCLASPLPYFTLPCLASLCRVVSLLCRLPFTCYTVDTAGCSFAALLELLRAQEKC